MPQQTDTDGNELVYCPTCRESHAVGAPHFKYAVRASVQEPTMDQFVRTERHALVELVQRRNRDREQLVTLQGAIDRYLARRASGVPDALDNLQDRNNAASDYIKATHPSPAREMPEPDRGSTDRKLFLRPS